MAIASASQGSVTYIPEVTYGVTPASPEMISLPVQSTALGLTREALEDPTISPDRLGAAPVPGNVSVAGDVVVTLRHMQYDALLEAALGGTWSSNVLKQGTTKRSFTIERGANDISQFMRFTGVRVNTFDVTITPGAIVTATFGLMGENMTTSQVALDLTPTAALDKTGLNSVGGTVSVGGSSVCVTSATINLNNGMTAAYCIGANSVDDVVWDKGVVTGSLTFYYEDLVQFNRFLNNTAASVSIGITDGANTITFTMPKVTFTGADVPLPNTGQMFITMPFVASRDVVTGTSLQITRT